MASSACGPSGIEAVASAEEGREPACEAPAEAGAELLLPASRCEEAAAPSPEGTRSVARLSIALSAAILLVAAAAVILTSRLGGGLQSEHPAEDVLAGDVAAEVTGEFLLGQCVPENGVDYVGGVGKVAGDVHSLDACCSKCLAIPTCTVWTWVAGTGIPSLPSQCWLKSGRVFRTVKMLDTGKVLSNYMSGRLPARMITLPGVSPYMLNYGVDHAAGTAPGFGCAPGVALPPLWTPVVGTGPAAQVEILTYNMEWWSVFDKKRPGEFYFHQQTKGNPALWLIKNNVMAKGVDLMAFQECNNVDWILRMTGLAGQYVGHQGPENICLAFKTTAWSMIGQGQAVVAEDKKPEYWGRRMAMWVRLNHKATGKTVLFMNHHGPLPVNSGGLCGGVATASRLLAVIAANAHPGETVILAGDFNAGQASLTIQQLKTHLNLVAAGTVHDGIDNIFTNLAPAAVLATGKLGSGGSDHDALHARLHL